MVQEIRFQRDYLSEERVNTIYFGGGTPSILDPRDVAYLLDAIYKSHRVTEQPEITLEANPDDLSPEKLRSLRAAGITRLSIGIQSFHDDILRYLNRAHDSATAVRSITLARENNFQNISIDLIYAIPGLSSPVWAADIERALSFRPEHLSAYTLTIEEKTAFGNWLSKGKILPVEEALAAEQQEILGDLLQREGYRHYEISNFALPGFESRHNSAYWNGEPYLGIGPSAHSYDRKTRQHNVANNHHYIRAIGEGKVPAVTEVLTRNDRINEYILTSLRTDTGCDLEVLKQTFDYDMLSLHGTYIHGLENRRLVTVSGSRLMLTATGKLLADRISSDLFLSD